MKHTSIFLIIFCLFCSACKKTGEVPATKENPFFNFKMYTPSESLVLLGTTNTANNTVNGPALMWESRNDSSFITTEKTDNGGRDGLTLFLRKSGSALPGTYEIYSPGILTSNIHDYPAPPAIPKYYRVDAGTLQIVKTGTDAVNGNYAEGNFSFTVMKSTDAFNQVSATGDFRLIKRN